MLARNSVPNTVCSEHLFRTLSLSPMKDHQNHPQNQPQDHQNQLQGIQNLTNKQPPLGGLLICRVLKPLKPILVVLRVALVVLELPPLSSSFTEASEWGCRWLRGH